MSLKVKGVSKHFGGLIALDKVSLEVQPHAIHSIIGPNGAGKTTLFDVLTGILPPTEGHVEFEGRRLTSLSSSAIAQLGFARTFQNIRLFHLMSILDNVRVGTHCWTKNTLCSAMFRTRRHKQEEQAVDDLAMRLLQTYGLAQRKDELAQNLPYGAQRRLEILRALAQDPKVLLLDEPTAGMNIQESAELTELIQHLRDDQGLTIVMIEHDMNVVMSISDTVTVLDYGKKIAEGSATEIQNTPCVIEAYLGRGASRGSSRE